MTGVDIVGKLLRASADVTAKVPQASIRAGNLPEGVALPALLLRTISVVDRQPLRRRGMVRRTDRVAVTVRAASYRDQVAVIGLVRACCAGQTGTVGDATGVAVLTAGLGPDVAGPANSFEQTQDFRVSFDEPA